MNTTLITSGLLCALAMSCATPNSGSATKSTRSKPSSTTSATPTGGNIRVGMSKSQVVRAWGEPSGKDSTASGEIWVYGNQNMLRMVPIAGSFLNVNTSKVKFNNSGRVVDFRNTNSGNVWSQGEGQGGSRFSSW